jgi:hypothetical protein
MNRCTEGGIDEMPNMEPARRSSQRQLIDRAAEELDGGKLEKALKLADRAAALSKKLHGCRPREEPRTGRRPRPRAGGRSRMSAVPRIG